MASWLVTGGNGFLGRHVLALLGSTPGADLFAIGRRRPAGIPKGRFIEADLSDSEALRSGLSGLAADFVIHTAGKTPPASDEELFRGNFEATNHLLAALRAIERPMRVVLAGSAAELGPVDESCLPVDENYPPEPVHAYGRSKWMATRIGLAEGPPLQVIATRIFNPIGPGTPPNQALGAFAARLAADGPEPIDLPVGDLYPRRDFVDVRDVAEALITLARTGRSGQLYHVGSGRSRSVAEGLDLLIAMSGRSVIVREDPALVRREGPADSRANIRKIVHETGWKPRIGFEESLRDLWNEVKTRSSCHRQADSPLNRLPLTA